jgi:hypothetical protein
MSDDTLTMCTDVYPLPRGIDNLRSVDTGVYATRGDQISMRKFLSTVYASSGRPGRSGGCAPASSFAPLSMFIHGAVHAAAARGVRAAAARGGRCTSKKRAEEPRSAGEWAACADVEERFSVKSKLGAW